ncbi:SIMPL domain-containing protein [Lewinellaceae bacterium SD302]|nr:SIMPL domain-containing protein [Lewinellaceae bacterium SD302]
MKQLTFVTFFLILVSPIELSAQAMGNYDAQQRSQGNSNSYSNYQPQYRGVPKAAAFLNNGQVEISINALANRRADSYTAIFSILQIGKTAAEANERMNRRLNAFKSGMTAVGIVPEDIYVDMVNFLPKYEYELTKKIFSKDNYTEVPSGFEIQKNVHVRYLRPEMLDAVITAAAEQEIYDIVKVDYFIDEPQEVYNELRASAFAYLQEQVELYSANGIALDSAYRESAENAWVAYPANRYESYQAFSSQRIPKGNGDVTKAEKPVSRFYNAIPANDYDIVLNPNILEPAVQFSYNLKIRFTLPPRVVPTHTRTVVKEQYLILTPEGKLIRMDIKENE